MTKLDEIEAELKRLPGFPLHIWHPSEGLPEEEIVIHGGPDNEIFCRMELERDTADAGALARFFAKSPERVAALCKYIRAAEARFTVPGSHAAPCICMYCQDVQAARRGLGLEGKE